MVRKILIIQMVLLLVSCSSMKTQRLTDGTKVPSDSYKFKKLKFFDSTVLKDIDLDYFYEREVTYFSDKNFKKVKEGPKDVKRSIQFYSSGHMRFFSGDRLSSDPQKTGRRGVIYKKNGQLRIDEQFAYQGGGYIYLHRVSE